HGYRDATSAAALERTVERDKTMLRELGVPIVADYHPLHEDEVGYRLETSDYELPAISFTSAEIAVLSLAATLWEDAALPGPARRGPCKARAVRAAGTGGQQTRPALRIRPPEESCAPPLEAIAERREVTFHYRAAATGRQQHGRVQPWQLLSRYRGWYLVGHDVDRQAPRAFRLSRMTSSVSHSSQPGAYEVPKHDATELLAGSRDGGQARLAVLPE